MQTVHWKRWVVPAGVLAIAATAGIVWLGNFAESDPVPPARQMEAETARQPGPTGSIATARPSGEAREPAAAAMPDAGAEDIEMPRLQDASPEAATIEDLTKKGFPLMSNPRREVFESTGTLSTEENVRDLGNLYTAAMSAIHMNGGVFMGGLGHCRRMTRHLKVLRAIEEGREQPARMRRLLEPEIEESMEDYEELQSKALSEWAGMASGEVVADLRQDDPYYREHRRYESPGLELQRRNEMAYAAFYTLANIRQLNSPELLARWIKTPHLPVNDAKEMNAWLIHQYFHQGGAGTPAAAKHEALAEGTGLASGTTKRARWNALWDKDHPLLRARDVNTSGIATIEVLKIPSELTADEQTVDAIIANFLAHAKTPVPTGDAPAPTSQPADAQLQ